MVIIRQAATYSHEADIGSVLLPKDKYLSCSFTVLYLFLVHAITMALYIGRFKMEVYDLFLVAVLETFRFSLHPISVM